MSAATPSIIASLNGRKIVAVLRAGSADAYRPVVAALVESGVEAIELTLTTPGTLEALPELVEQFPGALLGVGTVRTAEQASSAAAGGAKFVVAPNLNESVVAAAHAAGVPALPGVMTPSEVARALEAGCDAVKVFPAQTLGAGYYKHLQGPFPGLQAIPSGGVGLAEARAWLAAGAPAVSVGGPLLGDVFKGGSVDALRQRTAEFVAALNA
jgi:2-dehydro-3-deoxyphosphogluconate aldolase/(4S)-4-hydroxy-2-oxoglutarate aldolase